MNRLRNYLIDQATWWRSQSLEWWASHLTALYVGGAFTIIGARFDELILLKLNEIGDLSAGVFGPVAFLWLVLGYVQQGRELKLSSKALQLQAEELRHSVDQQKEMVGIAGRQLEAELEKILHEREQRKNSLLPNFKVAASVPTANSQLNVSIMLRNLGGLAEDVEVILGGKLVAQYLAMEDGGSSTLRHHLPIDDKNYDFCLKYKYGGGLTRVDNFCMKVNVSSAGTSIAQIAFIPTKDT